MTKVSTTMDKLFLTTTMDMSTVMDMASLYSTAEVATAIGVTKKTLLRWLWSGKLKEPAQTMGSSRVWTEADLDRAKRYRESSRKRS